MESMLLAAANQARADSLLTAEEHAELIVFAARPAVRALMAFDWVSLLTMLSPLLALIPGLGAIAPILIKLIPTIIDMFKKLPVPTPTPTPPVVVPPDGGGVLPTPH